MEKVEFGNTGMKVSRIGLGGFPFGGVNKARNWDPFSPEGRKTAIATIHKALDSGINYVDTAPGYGNGNSESLVGEVMKTRRNECFLATKLGWRGMDKDAAIKSVHNSMERLQTDYVDVIQFHGGMYTDEDYEHIFSGGPLDGLRKLKEDGKVRFIGLTSEEPWTIRPFIASGDFSVIQIRYNLIYQSAALHVLNEANERGIGVVTMRSMTSGIFQRIVRFLVPEWQETQDVYEVCLKFVLSDPRVHVANIGMRWPEEVEKNVRLIEDFKPPLDVSQLPRLTAGIYKAQDAEVTNGGTQ
ncbi:aldo/keto reductase [Candidatus Poribacteria bacterium]